MIETRKQLILDSVGDLVGDFLYYDRKEDEWLPRGEIELAISEGEISEKEIVDHFASELQKGLKK